MKSGPLHLPKYTLFIYFFSFLAVAIFNYSCEDKSLVESANIEFNVVKFEPASVKKTLKTPIYVHYMPWFQTPYVTGYWGPHWTMANINPDEKINGRRSIASHYYPLIGPYDSNDSDYLEYALICMKLSGIDGVLIDFYGQSKFNDYPQLLTASNAVIGMCEKVGLEFAIVYEDRTIKSILDQGDGNKIGLAKEDLLYIEKNYFTKSHYINIKNKPILLNFGPITLTSNEDWENVFSEIITDFYFFPLAYHPQYYDLNTIVDGVYSWVGEAQSDDFYNYGKQFDYLGGSGIFEFREFYEEGGWDNTGQSDILPRGGNLLRETLQKSITSSVDFIQLITWNDWGEGTAIEPSVEYQFEPLSIIQEFVGTTFKKEDLDLSISLYLKRKEYKNNSLVNKKLDQVFYYLVSLQTSEAKRILDDL